MANEADELLEAYLQNSQPKSWPRVFCCESSRSLYCPICCKILIPTEDWPSAIRDKTLRLPFDIDIILDPKERRTSSTGIHLVAINQVVNQQPPESDIAAVSNHETTTIDLCDLKREELPDYTAKDTDGTFVLFPDTGSVPISSVSSEIRKLVVLDIKWSRQSIKEDPRIASLPKVHLDSPPATSRFWRWHNSGDGMLSTAEAIYFAAMEVSSLNWNEEDRQRIVEIMWLFGLQRSVITAHSEIDNRPSPFTEEAKQVCRGLRQKQTGNPPKKKGEGKKFYTDLK